MKHLSESVARRTTGKYSRLYTFPHRPNGKEIVDFLESHGFEYCEEKKYTIRRYANDNNNKNLYTFKFKDRITIYRHGDDVEFRCYVDGEVGKHTSVMDPCFSRWFDSINMGSKLTIYDTYEEFRDAVTSHYGWE